MRAQLRAGLPGVSIEIAGEAATIEAARALNVFADAFLVAVDGRNTGDPGPAVRLRADRLEPDSRQGDRVRASRGQTVTCWVTLPTRPLPSDTVRVTA